MGFRSRQLISKPHFKVIIAQVSSRPEIIISIWLWRYRDLKGEKTSKVRILRLKSKLSTSNELFLNLSRKIRTLLVFSLFKSRNLDYKIEMHIFVRLETREKVLLSCILDMNCLM